MKRTRTASIVPLVLAATVHAQAASAASASCGTSTNLRPAAGVVTAGTAVARGLFLTAADQDAMREGGALAPLDGASPLAQSALDRTGLGSALAGQFFSPYNNAAGVLVGIDEPSRAKVSGRPPQRQALSTGGACARLAEGPLAEAAANAASFSRDTRVRFGEVRALTGPKGAGAESTAAVTMTDVTIAEVRIEQIVLSVSALADGKEGEATASSLVSGLTIAGERYVFDSVGLDPIGPAPDASALKALGIEFLAGGTEEHAMGGDSSRAVATGPVLRITSADGRVFTVVLGQASVVAERQRTH